MTAFLLLSHALLLCKPTPLHHFAEDGNVKKTRRLVVEHAEELDELDNLFAPSSTIQRAETLAADAFGAVS